jgi:hypothetical protein
VNGVSVMHRNATRTPSSHIARLSIGLMPNASSSVDADPSPVPNSTRPRITGQGLLRVQRLVPDG